ncbi:hypothetical protein [Flavobacterium sp.]|uniref:hypothetical protein n=1 Tax=Flavobacterium sp. TaxID=239 RepID=UPI00286DA0E9|nr:hypothetical protein [Flavobacterium sp.]
MKKKLEADLMSIAHRVLQMKNKSNINQLCIETRRLYEKLAILQFVEEHFDGAKPTIGQAEVVAKMKQFFEENHLTESKPATSKVEIVADNVVQEEVLEEEVVDQETEEDEIAEEESTPDVEVEFNETEPDEKGEIVEEEIALEVENEFNETEPDEEGEDIIADEPVKLEDFGFLPAFELDVESEAEPEAPRKLESIQISFEELLGTDYTQTHFVRVEDNKTLENPLDFELPKVASTQEEIEDLLDDIQTIPEDIEPKNAVSIEKIASVISIGLNDRIAFVKHLFGNSDEDYNRVMNQLITFDSFEEVQNFINDMVKPDYNDWQGKEEYEQRFIEIIEKKFA